MTTSGTTSFILSRDQVIAYALRKLGVLELGVTPDADTVTNSASALDMMVKSWITKGIKLWTISELTLPLTSATSYIIGPATSSPTPILVADKPMKLKQAWLRNISVTPQNDIPLQILSQFDYNNMGSKFSTGTPNSVYLQVSRENSTLYTYLTPDTTASTMYEVHLVTQRLLQDVGASTDNLDFPQEWLYALGWNLAAEMATDYGVDGEKLQYIELKAQKFLDEVEGFDVEYSSTFFAPDQRWQHR
jgi:hypothetical protein